MAFQSNVTKNLYGKIRKLLITTNKFIYYILIDVKTLKNILEENTVINRLLPCTCYNKRHLHVKELIYQNEPSISHHQM